MDKRRLRHGQKAPPQERGACRNRWACTPHYTPVLYALAVREVHEGQRLSMLGRQFSL